MIRTAFIAVGLAFTFLLTVPGWGETDSRERPVPEEQERQRERDEQWQRQDPCECCLKCMAVTRSVEGKEEARPPKEECSDCCRRCGSVPMEKKTPSETVK